MQKTAKVLLLAALFLNGSALARQENEQGDNPRPHKGKAGKQHKPADICGRIASDCAEDGVEGPFNSEVTSLLDLCSTDLCTPFLESHKCFIGCAGDCHREHPGPKNKKAAEECGQTCLECVDEEEPAPEGEEPTERKNIVRVIRNAANREEVRRAVSRRRDEEAPTEGEGEGEEGGKKHPGGKGGKGGWGKGGKKGGKGHKGGHHGEGEEPASESGEEPTERKSIVSVIRNAASREEVRRISRRQDENSNDAPVEGEESGEGENNNNKPHHGKGGKGHKGKGDHKGGKKGGHHGGPPTAEGFCKRVVEKCSEATEGGSRQANDDLCDQTKCEEWFSSHQGCFFQCSGECHKEHKGDRDAAEACIDEKCFDCTEEPAERHFKVVRRAARRQEEGEGEAPPAEDGEPKQQGPKDPCGPIQKKCSPHERALARSRRQEEEAGETQFDDLCDEEFCHGFFEHHKCSMKCLFDCHVAHKDNLDGFKECANPCLACDDQEPVRRRRQNGPRPPPTPEEFCGKVADKCAKQAEAEGAEEPTERKQDEGEGEGEGEQKTTKQDLCDTERCLDWYKDHSHCFFQCVGQCRQENPENKEGTEQCVQDKCFDCVEGPAPERRRRALRHH